MRLRPIIILFSVIILVGFLAYQIEFAFPATPNINNTYTPLTQTAPQEIGSYDVLGYAIDQDQAATLLQTDEGREQLSPQNGAVAVTEKLLKRGRDAFYSETFGDEIFQTEVVGALDGPINLVTMIDILSVL
ncbi:MAG: hypothetical protein KME05_17615 [Gloeocapsa sp. UFS-A4-WI-NPMV-4B04]|jgi:hypothetical protein|nr:hypothetical protein [Gloeocapsa sp. UFS-A4-WI-NPMV-4B04]